MWVLGIAFGENNVRTGGKWARVRSDWGAGASPVSLQPSDEKTLIDNDRPIGDVTFSMKVTPCSGK